MNQKVDIWMPIFWGDYLRDTGHLDTVEHGAYLLLIGHYWTTRKPLPDDDKRLSKITRLNFDEWLGIRTTISEFFEVRNGEWFHKRIEHELKNAIRMRQAASEKGLKGAMARWHPDDNQATDNEFDNLLDSSNEDGGDGF